jgi:hypothetical protein
MYTLSVGAVFKNEAHIMDEWIQHYLFHGVEHFYLINDGSTDDFLPIIEKYKDKVTLFNNEIVHGHGRQPIIYNTYIKPLLHETKWIAILDLDEFMYSPYYIDIKHVIKKYENYSQIIVYWNHFGSNGHIEQPQTVVESFTKRAVVNKEYTGKYAWKIFPQSCQSKSISQTNKLINLDTHFAVVDGESKNLKMDSSTISAELIINHYAIQSFNWFMAVKATRGDADGWLGNHPDVKHIERNEEMFRDLDINEVEDLRLAKQNRKAIKLN